MDIETFNTNLFKEVLNSFYDGIWITDGKGKVLFINKALKKISGISEEQVVGKSTKQILKEKIIKKSVALAVIKQKKPVTLASEYNNVVSIATGNPVFKDGEIIFVIINVRDITELDKIKRELEIAAEIKNSYQRELDILQKKICLETPIIAHSKAMENILETAIRVATFDTTVLITGETGVGKEVVARLIHSLSDRAKKPFMKIDCGALPSALLESELFGYVKGAFTGAKNEGKMGMVEVADGGTLFLDEIGNTPLEVQMKLLRVLQTGEFFRLGSTKPQRVNTRILAATNANLEELIASGQFREDLYYRINVVPIKIPPLRHRKEDIYPLIIHFLNNLNNKYNLNKQFTEESIRILINYDWPGNVRELKNTIERIIVLSKEDLILPNHITKHLSGKLNPGAGIINLDTSASFKNKTLKDILHEIECIVIKQAMQKHKTTTKVAEALGISQPSISRKLKKMRFNDQ